MRRFGKDFDATNLARNNAGGTLFDLWLYENVKYKYLDIGPSRQISGYEWLYGTFGGNGIGDGAVE